MASFDSLASTLRMVWRAVRYASFVFIVLAVWFLAREVWTIYSWCADIHVAVGIAFLVAFGVVFYWLIVRQALRYLAVPAAVKPPDLPALEGDDALAARHLKARARGITRYLEQLTRNPNLADGPQGAVIAGLEAPAVLDGPGTGLKLGVRPEDIGIADTGGLRAELVWSDYLGADTIVTARLGTQSVMVRAPGRVNLIGEHTDYNEGYVFPVAIDRWVAFAAREREDHQAAIRSVAFNEEDTFATSQSLERKGCWADLLERIWIVV